VQSIGEVQVDIPFRNLGFNGVHSRSNVLLQPTTDCLVSLTETPFLVITLADVEIAHLERVQVLKPSHLPI
jgi:nucleosome binding factor SPN SPT16 subunit